MSASPLAAKRLGLGVAEVQIGIPLQQSRPGLPLRRGLLLAVPVSAALFLELATDSPSKGSISTGALFCGFAGITAPALTRAFWQAAAAPIIAAAAALGVLTGSSPLLAVLTVAVVGPVVGYGFSVSFELGQAGRPVLAALIIAQGLELQPVDAVRALLYTGLGAYLQVTCSIGAHLLGRSRDRSRVPARRGRAVAAELLAQLTPRSTTVRHCMRLGLALAAGVASYQAIDLGEHGFWVPLTAMFVLTPEVGETLHRLTRRAWGTAIGLVTATVLAEAVVGDAYALATTLSATTVLAYATLRTEYGVFSAAITVYAVLLATTFGEPALDAVGQRALATAIGTAIAIAVFLLLPSPRQRRQALRAG